MISHICKSAMVVAEASNGNPIIATGTVILFYIFFNLIEGEIETLIFGARFKHILDPLFRIAFIGYAACTVYMCLLLK